MMSLGHCVIRASVLSSPQLARNTASPLPHKRNQPDARFQKHEQKKTQGKQETWDRRVRGDGQVDGFEKNLPILEIGWRKVCEEDNDERLDSSLKIKIAPERPITRSTVYVPGSVGEYAV